MDEEAEKELVKSKRDLLLERMQGKYPDQQFDDDEALSGAVMGDLDDYEGRLSKQDEVDRQLTERFEKDPLFGAHFMDMLEGKNPLVSLLEKYGDDFRAALEDPELAEDLAKANESYVTRLGKEKELSESYEANIAKSLDEADALVASGAYTDEQVDEAFKAILDDASKAMQGEISAEMLEMRLKGANYDQDVEATAQEAEVRGKNANIELKKKDLKNEIPMIEGNRSEVAPKKRNPTLDSLDGMTKGGNMWDAAKRRR